MTASDQRTIFRHELWERWQLLHDNLQKHVDHPLLERDSARTHTDTNFVTALQD